MHLETLTSQRDKLFEQIKQLESDYKSLKFGRKKIAVSSSLVLLRQQLGFVQRQIIDFTLHSQSKRAS
jgi:hypothetical protein